MKHHDSLLVGLLSYIRVAAVTLLVVAVAGCTSAQLATDGDLLAPPTGSDGVFGSGPQVVGVLAFDEPDNLSDAAPNSVYLAAQLAAETIKGTPLTVVVRNVGMNTSLLGGALVDFEALGAKLVIGTSGARDAADTAKFMATKDVPTISLTSFADLAIQLYGAAFVPNEEAVAIVNEMARRGLRSVAVVGSPGTASQNLTKAILGLAASAGITGRPVDGATDSQFVAAMTAMADAGVAVDGIVFAVGPVRASNMVMGLSDAGRPTAAQIVGNSGWATRANLPKELNGAWYPSLEGSDLNEFSEKFFLANGTQPTLNAALTYDLLVLAGALPQAVPQDPYHPEVLTSGQGFEGFTGLFKFGPTGMIAARNYVIATGGR